MKTNNQAIFDLAGTVFGVGKNIKEAIIEANDWLDPEKKITKAAELGTMDDYRGRKLGKKLFVCDCTEELMTLIKKNDGQIAWAENGDGLLDVVPSGNARTV